MDLRVTGMDDFCNRRIILDIKRENDSRSLLSLTHAEHASARHLYLKTDRLLVFDPCSGSSSSKSFNILRDVRNSRKRSDPRCSDDRA